MKGSATSEGQNDNVFYRTKVFSKLQQHRLSLGCMHAKNGDPTVTITTKKYGRSAPKSLSIEIDRWPHKGLIPSGFTWPGQASVFLFPLECVSFFKTLTATERQKKWKFLYWHQRSGSGRLRHFQQTIGGGFRFSHFHSSYHHQIYRITSLWQAKAT